MPSYVAIDVNCVGDETGGTAYISVTAEQDLDTGVKLWSAILEDHEIANSSWGGYNGKEMMWIPEVFPTPTSGTVLNFTGPYPQTIDIEGTYTLNTSQHPFNNLNFAVIVQGYESNEEKEVFNAYFETMPITSGVTGETSAAFSDAAVLSAWPSPSTGAFSIASQIPQGTTGTVEVFNISGRLIERFSAGSTMPVEVEESGVYLIRMTTSSGEIRNSQVAVIR